MKSSLVRHVRVQEYPTVRVWALDRLARLEREVDALSGELPLRKEWAGIVEEHRVRADEVGEGTTSLYARFYGLREAPFNLAPDSRFLYLGESHREALARLLYGIQERKGFVLITGEVGTGKTTLVHALLDRLSPDTRVAFLFNTASIDSVGLLWYMLEDLGAPVDRGEDFLSAFHRLNAFLIERTEAGENVALIVDEAQNLDPTMLEAIRQLSNLETSTTKLLQIVLVGQPELGETLEQPGLRQLRQRIAVQFVLSPLDRSDTERYILHRLSVAGSSGATLFTKEALRRIYRASGGIPRRINLLCDDALLAGYVQERRVVDHRIVREVARERERGLGGPVHRRRWLVPLAASVAAVGLLSSGVVYHTRTAAHRAPEPGAVEVELPKGTDIGVQEDVPRERAEGADPIEEPDQPPDVKTPASEGVDRLLDRGPWIVLVQEGDTLWDIAERIYGEATAQIIELIKDANPSIEDVDYIEVGQLVRMPRLYPKGRDEQSL